MAVLKMFTILDSKVEAFRSPFFCAHVGEAARMFERAANDKEIQIGQTPEDFSLFEVGEFDVATGVVTPIHPPKNHGLAVNYRKPSGALREVGA